MSLYRKYRPQNFEGLVGQDAIRTTLISALKLSKVHHAYLFTGPRGTGKTSTARILAKALNCLELKEATPCENCEICRDIAEGRLIDVIEIDAASNRGIDEMRDLREKINFSPTRAKNKIYIIDEVHMLTKEAFNALLKTLEEPPAQVYFILATTEVHKIPETIISRCQRFDFKRINDEALIAQLALIAEKEHIQAERPALEMVASHAQGGLRDGIGLMEQLTLDGKLTFEYVKVALGVSDFESVSRLFTFLKAKNVTEALTEISHLYAQGFDLVFFNKNFLEHLRRQLLKSVEKNEHALTSWLMTVIENFQQAYEQSRSATIQQLPLEMAIVKSCLEINVKRGVTSAVQDVPPVAQHTQPVAEAPAIAQAQTEKMTQYAAPVAQAQAEKLVISKSDETAISSSISRISSSMEANNRVHQSLSGKSAPSNADNRTIAQHNATGKTDTAAPQLKENTSAKTELTFENVQKIWKRIGQQLQTPMVKRSFQEARLGKVENGTIILSFSAQFHMEKLMQTSNRLELEKGFENMLGQPVKLAAVYEAIAQKVLGKTEDNFAGKVATNETNHPVKNEAGSGDNELTDAVVEIFGGEVV